MSANDELKGWFAGRIPKEWFSGTPEIRADRDEIWITVLCLYLIGDGLRDALDPRLRGVGAAGSRK